MPEEELPLYLHWVKFLDWLLSRAEKFLHRMNLRLERHSTQHQQPPTDPEAAGSDIRRAGSLFAPMCSFAAILAARPVATVCHP